MLLYVTYGADVIASIGTLCWLHRCYVHYLWHRCYCALWMAQMLLCPFHVIYYCTGVIVHYLWPRCYWAIFCFFFFFCFYFLFILLSHYFIFSSGILNNILSQMCGRLYFPIFLLSVGLFTLMYIDSDCSGQAVVFSSNYFEILYGYFMPTHVLMLEYWWWGLQVFLVSFPKCSPWFKIMKNNNFLEILRQNIFPYRPEEAAMFGCKSLSI